MTLPNVVVSLSALPKTGKNHFAYTSEGPIRVYCFNGGADFIKTKFPDKQIDVVNFRMPIIEDNSNKWASPLWEQLRDQYIKDIDSGIYRTYVFDTATEIENIIQQAVLEDLQELASDKGKRDKEKLATTEFLARNLKMKSLFDRAKSAGVNLISLQYLKEEWVKQPGSERAEQTGKYVIDGWKRTESQADINLEMTTKEKPGAKGRKKVTVTKLVSNRFDQDIDGQVFEDTTFDEILMIVFPES